MIFSHAFAGAILGKYIVDFAKEESKGETENNKLTNKKISLIYLFTIVGSIFPDLDLSLMFFNHNIQHRYLITHSFLFYSGLFVLMHLFKKRIDISLVLSFYLGVLSHLLLDFFAGGIVALAPLTYKLFGYPIKHLGVTRLDFANFYVRSNYMLAELSLFFAYLFLVYEKTTNFVAKRLPVFLFIISCVALGVFALI